MDDDPNRTVLMLLDDRRTFSNITGCSIISVPDNWTPDDITDALRGDRYDSEQLWIITEFRTLSTGEA